jgi:molecular chaperone GrpE
MENDNLVNEKNFEVEKKEFLNKINLLESELEKKKEEIFSLNQKILYARADFENLRRNTLKEINTELIKSNIKLINQILSIYDDFERCLSLEAIKNEEINEGLSIINKLFNKFFTDNEIKELTVNDGFNPEIHDAIAYDKSDKETGEIISVIKKGYKYKEIIIRPVQVIVAA